MDLDEAKRLATRYDELLKQAELKCPACKLGSPTHTSPTGPQHAFSADGTPLLGGAGMLGDCLAAHLREEMERIRTALSEV